MNDVKSILIRILQSEFENKHGIVGTVKSVNGNNVVVENLETEGVYSNVRLQANPGNGVLIIPAVGSYVIVGRLTGDAGYIAMVSDADSIQLLDGSYGGLIKIDDLVNSLNALEKYTRDMTIAYDAHTHGGSVPVPALPAPAGVPDTSKATLENDLITHGSI